MGSIASLVFGVWALHKYEMSSRSIQRTDTEGGGEKAACSACEAG